MSEWISVEDRLPMDIAFGLKGMEEIKVLVTDGIEVSVSGFQRGSGGGYPWATFDKYNDMSPLSITHWMPLPVPPNA